MTDIKSFTFNKLNIELHPDVYDPAEDTFQLLEAIEIKPEDSVLEIGTGCGIIALECARLGANVSCTDINPYALELVQKNIKQNNILLAGTIKVRKSDLFSAVKKTEKFDVIIFNPPYLPTQTNEHVDRWFDRAVDGGIDGLQVTKRFIENIGDHLHQSSKAYFVYSSLSNRKKLERYLEENKLKFEIISSGRYDDEILDIYCIAKN